MRKLRYVSAGLTLLALLLSVGLSAAQPPAPPPLPEGSIVQNDVEYGVAEGVSLKLNLAIPPGPGPFPGLIMIHGGGWQGGDKKGFNAAFPTYLSQGIACFSVNYRMAPKFIFPAEVDDCLTAVRWVRAHAAEYKVDPDRLGVIGGSAGGHLSLMVATAPTTPQDLNAQGEQLKSLVVAAVSLSGPTDFVGYMKVDAPVPPADPHWYTVGIDLISKFVGGTFENMPEKFADASPIAHVTANTPPTLLAYGTGDALVPPGQAERMAAKLKAAGVPVVTVPMQNKGHEVQGMSTLPQAVQFLVEHLCPAAAFAP